jgi:glycosyltransferase 2 family protein
MSISAANKASRWTLVIALPLAAVLLIFAFRGVNWATMLGRLSRGRLDLLALAFLTYTTTFSVRALRWRVLLSAEKRLAPLTVFWATMVGYLGNSFLPARAGELIRSGLLARKTRLSMSYVLATALVERVLDVVALVLISAVAITTLPSAPIWLVGATRVLGILALFALLVFVVLPRVEPHIQRPLARILGATALQARLASLLNQFLLGMRAFQHVPRGVGFAGLTLFIWLGDSVALVIVARAFDLTLALPQALILNAALGLASAAPSTPGYVGIFQFVAVTVLAPFGFARDEALAFILGAQAVIYAIVIVWGMLGLWFLGIRSPRVPLDVTQSEPTARTRDGPGVDRPSPG